MELSRTEKVAEELAASLMESDEYKRYKLAEKKIKEFPGLYEEVNNFRKTWLRIQEEGSVDLFSHIDRVEQEYQELRDNKYVQEFLASELAFCRLYQKINFTILDGLDFNVDFLRQ